MSEVESVEQDVPDARDVTPIFVAIATDRI
jgi:hypothetical protein